MSDITEAERRFLQVCEEHSCQGIELKAPFLLGAPTTFSNYRILEVEQCGGVLEAAGLARKNSPYTLQVIMHCETLFLRVPPSAITLRRLFALNGKERETAFLVDQVKPYKILLTIFVSDLDKVPDPAKRKELIWKSVRRLYEVWKPRYNELREIVNAQESEPQPVHPPARVSPIPEQWSPKSLLPPTVTTRQQAKEILTKYLNDKEFKNLKTARKEQFDIIYFAVVNNGATLSKPSRTFPQVFFFSEKMMVAQIIYSRNETPFSVPSNGLPMFQELIVHINNRLKLGRFQITKNDKQISYQYFLPFHTLTEKEVELVIPKTIEFCIDRFKLYSMSFSKLWHTLESKKLPGDISAYCSISEEIKPEYKDEHSTTNIRWPRCKRVIKAKKLRSAEEYSQIKQQYEDLKSEISDSLLQCLSFDDDQMIVSCKLEDDMTLLKFVKDYGHEFEMSKEVMNIGKKLGTLNLQLPANYESAFYVRQSEDGSFKCRLLPWNLAAVDERSQSTSSELITKILNNSDTSRSSSEGDLSFFIPEADIEQKDSQYTYKGEVVKLWCLPCQEDYLKSMTKYLVTVPCHSNMPYFRHMYGFVDLESGERKRRFRVQKRLPALYKRQFPSKDKQKVCEMLLAVGKALHSLHQFEWKHYCLTPRFLAFENRTVYFRNCAFIEKAAEGMKMKVQDLWFLAPEELKLLKKDSADAFATRKICGKTTDVYSYSRLLYFYFVDSGQHDRVHDAVPSFNVKRKEEATGVDIDAALDRYEEGRRPLIPETFEDAHPMLAIRLRQSWESPENRPDLGTLIDALETEGEFDLSEEDSA